MRKAVSIVIVNYNGADFLKQCLSSVLAQTREVDHIVLVDNASTDSSLSIVHDDFPMVRVIALDRNIGFAQGCNQGVEACSADLIALMNNDVVLDPHWLERLLEHDREPWSFWASLIVLARDSSLADSAGDGMAVVGAGFKIGHCRPVARYQEPREVFGPCAAAALYRRSVWEATGGFDPDFFLIYEDADFNLRARLQDFRCLYVPSAVAYHHVNSSIGRFSENYVFFGHRNSEYVFWKNMPLALLLLYLPERLLFDFLCFLFFLSRRRYKPFLRAKLDFLRNLPVLLAKRRHVQQSRTVGARQLRKALARNWLRYRLKNRTP